MINPPVHPWHRLAVPVADRRALRAVEQRLAHQHPHVPVGRIIRMVHGTARLIRSAGPVPGQLAAQVEAACRAALALDSSAATGSPPNNVRRV